MKAAAGLARARPGAARGPARDPACRALCGPAARGPAHVHETAVVEAGAAVGPGCAVGAFAVVGSGVRLGEGVRVGPHAVITGDTVVGAGTEVHPFAVVGGPPQDRKHAARGASRLHIGAGCVVREFVTVNGGTELGGGLTAIGDRCLLLANSHVGHDCILAPGVVVSNLVQLAGHVHVGPLATLGGACTVRQHTNIGRLAMIGGASAVDRHVPPFALALGNRARLRGLNLVGLRRQGVAKADIAALRDVLKRAFGLGTEPDDGTMAERAARCLELYPESQLVRELVAFVRGDSSFALSALLEDEELAAGTSSSVLNGLDDVAVWDARRLRIGLVAPGTP